MIQIKTITTAARGAGHEYHTVSFDNHLPLRFRNKPDYIMLGDGGAYCGIGYHTFDFVECQDGKRIHCWESFSSGCSYNNQTDRSITYLGEFDRGDYNAAAKLVEHLGGKKAGAVLEYFATEPESFIEIPVC